MSYYIIDPELLQECFLRCKKKNEHLTLKCHSSFDTVRFFPITLPVFGDFLKTKEGLFSTYYILKRGVGFPAKTCFEKVFNFFRLIPLHFFGIYAIIMKL